MSNPIEYLKGVGPLRADLLKKELNIFTFGDLLSLYPYRHIDRTKVNPIRSIGTKSDYVQVRGRIIAKEIAGEKRARRFVAVLQDDTGSLELVWFQGIQWIEKTLQPGTEYLVFGKPGAFLGRLQLTHPEIEPVSQESALGKPFLEPVYPSTEKLKARGLGGRQIAKLTAPLVAMLDSSRLPENLPAELIGRLGLASHYDAIRHIHFPPDAQHHAQAVTRVKFEELFLSQIRLGMIRSRRHRYSKGIVFETVGNIFHSFYRDRLPFELTGAQKRVLKEIRSDTGSGRQMNRLLQGDVGSGKTMVALLSMLLAADNNYQSCLMAPTEILAQQHFESIKALIEGLRVNLALLTGSTNRSEKKEILQRAAEGSLDIVIGTHALIEDQVGFARLGMAIVDEQHRFGVAQRARLWEKSEVPPHVLVMTATPIPRTLAMTAYGDLDYSVMDEMPPGRLPITTVHRLDDARPSVMDFIKEQIHLGRQAYIIFPLIEESEKMDYEDLMQGYEQVKAYFPEPKYWISMVHGRMNTEQKEANMQRFKEGETQIMVSTTVVEVGVNVPNASVMVIESAEKFGLSQLHQLRGRVGRGKEKSYCILLTGRKLSAEARARMSILCETNDGFKIADRDLELRGPGEIEGTRQSGLSQFKLANLVDDRELLEKARQEATRLLEDDPELGKPEQSELKSFLYAKKGQTLWSKIS